MSNFSNIGINISTQEEFQQLLEKAYKKSLQVKIECGSYSIFTDSSGAELFVQFNKKNLCIGANPHFKGISKRTVCLTNEVKRPESQLDGAFHCWADPTDKNDPDTGAYPFVFDVPDFKTIGHIDFPNNFDINLVAFPQEMNIYANEKEYFDSQDSETKFAVQSFIPIGLFSIGEENDPNPQQALGFFSGVVKEYEKKVNELTNQEFYWLLIDALGGEIDIVADIRFFDKAPVVNGIVKGEFWLSGRLINPPKIELRQAKTFIQRLFGR